MISHVNENIYLHMQSRVEISDNVRKEKKKNKHFHDYGINNLIIVDSS